MEKNCGDSSDEEDAICGKYMLSVSRSLETIIKK